jgi:hypothetical protein
MRSAAILTALLLPALSWPLDSLGRDPKQRAAFQRLTPCPATGKVMGACPGYIADHLRPLCLGGEDHPRNFQWLTVEEAKRKDRADLASCRERRKTLETP